ncbi:MAG: aminotransferase class V-fold PLP-dependent enzyme, partial [Proteobacteria bacterium]|nr:aminotransferase class V-fold PLP-dependent enzyme [Pseudomonadota bacterium]
MTLVYLDNNATTRVAREVLDAMLPYFSDHYGNPSSMHTFGGRVGREIETARERVANLLGATPREIIFTSCGTESDNTAIWSALRSNPGKKHVITSRVEHPAIKNLCEHLSKNGYRVSYVPVDQNGELDIEFLKDQLSDDTALVSIMWANNET